PAPDDFRTADKRVVNRALQRPPPERGVGAEEPRGESAEIDPFHDTGRVVTVRDREAEIDIRRFREILVRAEVPDIAHVAALARLEQIVRVAAKHLSGRLEKQPR